MYSVCSTEQRDGGGEGRGGGRTWEIGGERGRGGRGRGFVRGRPPQAAGALKQFVFFVFVSSWREDRTTEPVMNLSDH